MKSPAEILKTYWGHDTFREHQEEIISSVINGQDVVALLPTGGGKSVCYQVPAIYSDGVCLVISPLIALMHDQVEQLKLKGIKAAALTSEFSSRQSETILENAANDPNFKLLYIAPERIKARGFIERLKHIPVSFIAVDEAHCISQWGYDFRPSYLEISKLKTVLPDISIIALTATATPEVVEDIGTKLNLHNPTVYRSSFKRDNLSISVIKTDDKMGRLSSQGKSLLPPGIVYCNKRKSTQIVSDNLRSLGIKSDYYHAGLKPDERKLKQSSWIKSHEQVIVSTNAFGMGIDKADVRFVLHFDFPANIEAYYQEIGRAGRDGKEASTTLIYNTADIHTARQQIELQFPEKETIKKLYEFLCSKHQVAIGSGENEAYSFDYQYLMEKTGLSVTACFHGMKMLERAGLILLYDNERLMSQFRFKCTKEALYQYQVSNPEADKIVSFLLRTHIGVFQDYVRLNESMIASKLALNNEKVQQQLRKLQQLDLADYQESTGNNSFRLLTPRLPKEHISIPANIFEKRKELLESKLQSMIDFLEISTCRMNFILHYFGEYSDEICGKCDNCLRDKTTEKISKQEILKHIDSQPVEIEYLINMINSFSREEILQEIRQLQDDGKILIDTQSKTIRKPQI